MRMRAVATSGGTASLTRRLRRTAAGPDRTIVGTVRLVALLLTVAFGVFLVLLPATMSGPWSVVGFGSIVLLLGLWIRGYRRGRFSLGSLAAESGLVFLTCATYEPEVAASMGGVASLLRCMYGSWPRRLALVTLWQTAVTGGYMIQRAIDGDLVVAAQESLWRGLPNFVVLGGIGAVLATVLQRHELNVARDRVVLGAGAELVAADSREHIHRVMLGAAEQLLGTSGGAAFIASPRPGGLVVVAGARTRPDALGSRLPQPPKDVQETLGNGEPVRLTTAHQEYLRALEPVAGRSVDAAIMGLAQPCASADMLFVTSDVALSAPIVSGLTALTATVTLALRNVALTEDLRRQAFVDALTGLANRAMFGRRLAAAVERAHLDRGRMALLLLDLDGFKAVNDGLGHAAGDRLLVVIGERLRDIVRRPHDTVARLGGDEFTIVLDGVDNDADATAVADRVLAAVQVPIELSGTVVSVGCSIGIAYGDSSTGAEQLLVDADLAMYHAKANGKRRFEVSTPQVSAGR